MDCQYLKEIIIMSTLLELPNISKVIEGKLFEVGIDNPQLLEEIGSKKAFFKIKQKDCSACINMLFALEGAIQGIRWHQLPDYVKNELKAFYKTLVNTVETEKFD
jgi:DNA transformation protein